MPAKVQIPAGYWGTRRLVPRGRDHEERRDFEPVSTADPNLRDLERRLAALEQRQGLQPRS